MQLCSELQGLYTVYEKKKNRRLRSYRNNCRILYKVIEKTAGDYKQSYKELQGTIRSDPNNERGIDAVIKTGGDSAQLYKELQETISSHTKDCRGL